MLGKSTRILDGKVNFPLCLAPMVGLSHVCLRMILREYLPEGAFTIWPTEMLNSRRIPHEVLGATPETMKAADEDGLVPQLLGNDEEAIHKSIQALELWGAIGIDINMGCPVAKALRHNYGVSLMGDVGYAADVVRFARKASALPVSVKLRAGLQGDPIYLRDFTQALQGAGASWITLHPRTAEQKRRGSADWSQIKTIRGNLKIPVIGNGDIQTSADVFQMLNETDCDAVMAGRALAARPWMLWQLGEELGFPPPKGKSGSAPRSPVEEGQEYGRMLLRWLELAESYFQEEASILRRFRFFVRTTAVWLPFGQSVVSLSTKEKSVAAIKDQLKIFFSQEIEMSARTELRQ